MTSTKFCVFDTAIGACAIAWRDNGIVGASLPGRNAQVLRSRMTERHAGAVEVEATAEIAAAIGAIRGTFRGEKWDMSSFDLDMQGIPEFNRRVYEIARRIPAGATLTYGEIASLLGDVRLSRAVGQVLGENPFPPLVPCHRVLSAEGRMHGFSATGGVALKLRMLQLEGWEREQLSFFEAT